MHSKEKGLLYIQNFLFLIPNGNHTQKPKTETHNLKKRRNRGKKNGIPPNKNNRQKHRGKEPMETQSYQESKDKKDIGNPHT